LADKDILEDEVEAFEAAVEAETENRNRALESLRFNRLGDQWPEKIKQDRILAQRPVLTLNHAPAFIRQVVNDSRMNRPQITVKPVDSGADIATANVYKGLIKTIETQSKADIAYDTAVDFAASMGFGYLQVAIEYEFDDSFDKGLRIKAVENPFSVYGDPFAKGADSSEWNKAFVTDLMTIDDFNGKYKGAEQVDWTSSGYDSLKMPWREENQILIAESWSREEVPRTILLLSNGQVVGEDQYKAGMDYFMQMGITVQSSRLSKSHKVTQRIMTGAEVLEENDWAGRYIPIIPVYGEEVNVEGKRHFFSLTHHAMDAMRMHNYWRTTATEVVALAPRMPFIGEEGAFDVDTEKWQTANTENWSYVQYKKGKQPPMRQPIDSTGAAGSMQQAMAAVDDMKAIIGMYDASLGNRSNETSGVAINSRKHEGDVSTYHIQDNLSRAIRHVGVVLTDLIPLVYSNRQVIRILGDDGTETTVKQGPRPEGQPAQPPMPTPQQKMHGANAQPLVHPNGQEHIYDLGVGKYDIVVDTGPSFTTRREQIAQEMMAFLKAFPQAAPVVGDIFVKELDWPQGEEIADRLKAMLPPQAAGGLPPEVQSMMQDGQKMIGMLQQKVQQATQENSVLKAQSQIKDQVHALELEKKDVELKKVTAVHAVQNAMPEPQVADPGFGPDQYSEALQNAGALQIDAYDAETKRIVGLAQAHSLMNPQPKPVPSTPKGA